MNQDQINWILEAEKNNALNPEQQQWLAQAREAGAFSPNARSDKTALGTTWDRLQQVVGEGIENYAGEGGFGSWLADQSADLAGYVPEYGGDFLDSSDKLNWVKERGLENAAMTALPYVGTGLTVIAAATAPVWGTPALLASGAIAGTTAVINFLANSGDVASDYKERMKQLKGKDFEMTGTDRATVGALSTVITAIDVVPPLKLVSGVSASKEAIKKGLVELATTNPVKFLEASKNLAKDGLLPFLKTVGYEVTTESVQKGVSMAGADIAGGEFRDAGEYFNEMLNEGLGSIVGAGGGATIQTALAPSAKKEQPAKAAPLPSERTGLSGSAQNAMDLVSTFLGRKSVSVLNNYSDSQEAMNLRNELEHFEKFEGPEGMVKGPDWYETKQNNMGDLYAPVENAFERIRDSWGGRSMSKGLQERLLSIINGTSKVKLNKTQMDAYQQLKAGNEGPAKNLSRKERRDVDLAYAAYTAKNAVAETDTRLEAAGVVKGYERQGNIPFFFNRKNIRNNMGAFANWLTAQGYADNQAHGRRIAQGIISNGGVAYQNDPLNARGENTSLNKTINPKTVPQQFRETNIEKALPKYTLRAANRIAYANVFGGDGKGVEKRIKKIQEELAQNGRVMEKEDVEQIRNLSDAMLNRYNPVYNETISAVNRGIASFEALSTLGGATLSSAQEPFVMIERMGLTPFVKSLPNAINTLARGMIRGVNRHLISPSGDTSVARDLGIALDATNAEVLTSAFTGDYSGVQDAFFKSPFGMFLHQWTTFNRIWGTNVGMKVLDSWADQAAQGKFKESQYKDLGLTKEDMQGIALIKQQTGMSLEQLLVANARNPNQQIEAVMNTVLPSGRTLKDVVRPALTRMVNESVIAPRATNRPMWMNDQRLTALSMLKSFPIVFGNTVAKRMVKKIDPRNLKNMTPCEFKNLFVAGAAMFGAAYAMIAVKDALKGKDVRDRPWVSTTETPEGLMQSQVGQAINQTGILGPYSFLTDTYQYGPSTFAGPALSEVPNLMEALKDFGEGKIFAEDLAKMATERTARIFGALDKYTDLGEIAGNYLYNLVD